MVVQITKVVALSTIEVDFTAITEACKDSLWLNKFLQELGFVQDIQNDTICR